LVEEALPDLFDREFVHTCHSLSASADILNLLAGGPAVTCQRMEVWYPTSGIVGKTAIARSFQCLTRTAPGLHSPSWRRSQVRPCRMSSDGAPSFCLARCGHQLDPSQIPVSRRTCTEDSAASNAADHRSNSLQRTPRW